MNKLKLAWNVSKRFIDQHLPSILTGLAIMGLGASVGNAVQNTLKLPDKLDAAKIRKLDQLEAEAQDKSALDIYKSHDDGDQDVYDLDKVKLSFGEYIKLLTPIYWPTALCTVGTGACIVFSNHVSAKRIAALTALVGTSERTLREYQDKVKEVLGEKKEKDIRHELAKDWAMDAPGDEDICLTKNGTYLIYEPISKQYFRSSQVAVGQAAIQFNKMLQFDQTASLNDWLNLLDIDEMDPYVGDHLMWDVTTPNDLLDITFDYSGNCRTGEPCLVIDYRTRPVWVR